MKAILIVNIDDELLEDYENFYVDYDLRAERKDDNVNESIRYVEDCALKPLEENYISIDWLKHNIPFQSMSISVTLLSMLEAWRNEHESNISN